MSCEYCTGDRKLSRFEESDEYGVWLFRRRRPAMVEPGGWDWVIGVGREGAIGSDLHAVCSPNFCPMCGCRLDGRDDW